MARWLCVLLALGFLAGAAVPGPARGQAYPSKVINIVVTAPPGGVTDTLGRMLAVRFSQVWGQQAIVENRAGANNIIAAEYVAKSSPDGQTLLIGPEVTSWPIRASMPSCPTTSRISRRSWGSSSSITA